MPFNEMLAKEARIEMLLCVRDHLEATPSSSCFVIAEFQREEVDTGLMTFSGMCTRAEAASARFSIRKMNRGGIPQQVSPV